MTLSKSDALAAREKKRAERKKRVRESNRHTREEESTNEKR